MRSHGQEDAQTVTLPVLKDGERYVADSWAIAKYLEQKVPSPTIFPGGLEAHEKFQEYVLNNLHKPCLMWVLPQIPVILDDRGAEYFTRTREERFGKTLAEVSSGGDAEWLPQLRGNLTPVFHALRSSGAYILGKDFGYCDVLILSVCQWIRRADESKLQTLLSLDADGHFRQWFERCEPYSKHLD